MKKALCAAAVLALFAINQALAQQRPTYDAAIDLTRKMQEVISATGVWHKKPPEARIKAARDAEQLRLDIEKMLGASPVGEFGQCKVAASYMETYVQNLNALTLIVEGRRQVTIPSDVMAPAFHAFHFGDAYRACQDSLEVLYVTPKKK